MLDEIIVCPVCDTVHDSQHTQCPECDTEWE